MITVWYLAIFMYHYGAVLLPVPYENRADCERQGLKQLSEKAIYMEYRCLEAKK